MARRKRKTPESDANDRESDAVDLLAVLLRAGLQGHSGAGDAAGNWRDVRFDQLRAILTDRAGNFDEDMTGSEASPQVQLADFRCDVTEYIDYLEAFQGLDLGTWLQALLHSRFVARILRKHFNYVHSFIVLRETKPGAPDAVLIPFLLHERNAPRFPSGEWVLGENDDADATIGRPRLTTSLVAGGLQEYARRLRADRSVPLVVETFLKALDPWLDAGTRSQPPRFALRRDSAQRLAVFFASLTHMLLKAWDPAGRGTLPPRLVEELPCAIHRLIEPQEALIERDRPAFFLFALAVMERASFRRMAERSQEILQPLLDRSVDDGEKTELERRLGLTYFDAGRLTFQSFADDWKRRTPLDPRATARRSQSLAAWLWRKVQSSRSRESDDGKRGRSPELEADACQTGLARLGCAAGVLDLQGSAEAARSALRRFEEWEWSRYRCAPLANADRTSPWTRDMQALPLARLYDSLKFGFSIAVHATGPVNHFARERPQVESFRIDIVKDTAETDPDPWDAEKVRRAIRRTLQMDRLFSQAEMLAVDTQRRRILEAAAKEHERSLRLYTAWNVHELQYELRPLDYAVYGTQRLDSHLVPFFGDERSARLDPTAKSPRPMELDDAAFLALGNTLLYLAAGFVGKEHLKEVWARARAHPEQFKGRAGWFVSAEYKQIADTCREFIQVTQETATLQPEAESGEPVMCPPSRVIREVFDSQRKSEKFEKAIHLSIDPRLDRPDQPLPFPESTFRHAILPELLRNAFRFADSRVVLEATVRTTANGDEFFFLSIVNDDNGAGREDRHEGGRVFVAGAIRANLGLIDSDDVSEFYTYGWTESGDYYAEVRFPFERYRRACANAQRTADARRLP